MPNLSLSKLVELTIDGALSMTGKKISAVVV